MAKQQLYYKGRRKKRNYAIIPAVILLLALSVFIVLFYSMQKYAVITEDAVYIDLPILSGGSSKAEAGNLNAETKTYDPVSVDLQFLPADYSRVQATAGKTASPVRAIFVPYDEVNAEKIDEYAKRLSAGNALVLELKQESGYLAWYSRSRIAADYGINTVDMTATDNLTAIVSNLKSKEGGGIYMVAQISCLVDNLLGSRCNSVTLKNQYGMDYGDDQGFYLDPYNPLVREYIADLVRELYEIGFDEVILDNVVHPVIEQTGEQQEQIQLRYTVDMSTTPGPVGGVSSFIVNIAERLSDRDSSKRLSAYLNSAPSLVKPDDGNGQEGALFLKVFDRVYYDTDKYAYSFNLEDITPSCTVGDVHDRFVPVVLNYLPDNSSWVLVDYDEE